MTGPTWPLFHSMAQMHSAAIFHQVIKVQYTTVHSQIKESHLARQDFFGQTVKYTNQRLEAKAI